MRIEQVGALSTSWEAGSYSGTLLLPVIWIVCVPLVLGLDRFWIATRHNVSWPTHRLVWLEQSRALKAFDHQLNLILSRKPRGLNAPPLVSTERSLISSGEKVRAVSTGRQTLNVSVSEWRTQLIVQQTWLNQAAGQDQETELFWWQILLWLLTLRATPTSTLPNRGRQS